MMRNYFQLVLSIAALLIGVASAQAPPTMDANRWNLNTAKPAEAEVETEPPSTLNMRVYKDFDGGKPAGENPYAVDVSAVMTRCSDGSLIVTALVIGGKLTPLDNRCPTTNH